MLLDLSDVVSCNIWTFLIVEVKMKCERLNVEGRDNKTQIFHDRQKHSVSIVSQLGVASEGKDFD